MTYVLSLLVTMSGADVVPQTRWVCAALLGGPDAPAAEGALDPAAPILRSLGEARRSSRPPPAKGLVGRLRRLLVERDAIMHTARDVEIDDVRAAGAALDEGQTIHRHHVLRRASRRLHELFREPADAFERVRVVSGGDRIAAFLSEALAGATRLDRAHAADLIRRRDEALAALERPVPRPLTRGQKLAVTLGADAALLTGAALGVSSSPTYAGAALVGFVGWTLFRETVYVALARGRGRLEALVYARRRASTRADFDEDRVVRSASHVRALERMIEVARAPGPDPLTLYHFDVELPLRRGAAEPLDADTIFKAAAGPAPGRSVRWATVELVLSRRDGVPTLRMFAREIANPFEFSMNTYLATLDPAGHPLGFH